MIEVPDITSKINEKIAYKPFHVEAGKD